MKASIFSRVFPLPRILRTNPAGFDLSSDSLKIINIKRKDGGYKVGKFGEVMLPEGCIVKGEIKNREPLKKIFGEVKKKYGLSSLVVSLPEEKSYIININIPYVEPKEIKTSIELQLEEHIPIPAKKVIFDYEVTGYNSVKDELMVNIAVLPSDLVCDYLKLFEEVELDPLVFGTEAGAVSKAVIPKNDLGVYMIVDFGANHTGFFITAGGYIGFNATLDFGGEDITRAVMKYFNVGKEEAEKLKIDYGISKVSKTENILNAAFPALSVLKDEVNKYLNYWNTKAEAKNSDAKPVEEIVFCGGSSALPGLSDYLAGEFEIPFRMASPWTNIISVEDEIPPIHQKDSLKFTTAIGLALQKYEND